jgi:signal transduction histidine kinase
MPRRPYTLRTRLASLSSLVFVASFLAAYGLVFVIVLHYLRSEDRLDLQSKAYELITQYRSGGLQAIRDDLALDRLSTRDRPFFLRIADAENREVLVSMPRSWSSFDFFVLETLSPSSLPAFMSLSSQEKKFRIEVTTMKLDDDLFIQVGGSTEMRERVLVLLFRAFLLVFLPALALLYLVMHRQAASILKPLQDIISAVRSVIRTERYSTVIPVHSSSLELKELSRLFNTMMQKVDASIKGLQGSLDSIAHDLRTPLTRMKTKAEMSLQQFDDPERLGEALSYCLQQTKEITSFVAEILDLSQAESGILRLRRQPCDLLEVIRSVVEVYRFIAEERCIRIRVSSPDCVRAVIDPSRVRQVISNILDNAVKHAPAGSEITVALASRDGWAEMEIADQGEGIPPGQLEKIWERGYRYPVTGSGRGKGLGLSIARAIVQAHGGAIQVSSAPGAGSRFTVHLPA